MINRINGKNLRACTIEEIKEVYVGRKYGKLTILDVYRKPNTNARCNTPYAKCKCDCGTIKEFTLRYLINGHPLSCGCRKSEKIIFGRTSNSYILNPDGTVSVVASNNPNIIFTVDLCTWVWLSHLTWGIDSGGYMTTGLLGNEFRYHTLLYPVPPGRKYVRDHRNRCRLDNRYCNLRVVTSQTNSNNTTKSEGKTTDVIGVYEYDGKYRAMMNIDNHSLRLHKQFSTFEEAVAQRKEWERMYIKEEELDVPPLFLPNGELNVYNFPFYWYPDKYIKIWGILGIRVLPYPYAYDYHMNTLNRLFNRNNY